MFRNLALRTSGLVITALLLAGVRSATAGTITESRYVKRDGCERFVEPSSRTQAESSTVDATRVEDEKLAASRNPNYPAAFVFETHSASYLALGWNAPGIVSAVHARG